MILRAESLSKIYAAGSAHAVQALSEVTIDVPRGAITLLHGPSGSGKTTLLALLGTLLRPSSGRVFLDGQDLSRASDAHLTRLRRDRLGFVFQGFALVPGLEAWRNVALPLVPVVALEAERRRRATALLATLGLGERARSRPDELSGGEQQRVAIARALVGAPDILLADEPTSSVDQAAADNFCQVLAGLRERGTTVVVSAHDPRLERLADQVVCLRGGRLDRP